MAILAAGLAPPLQLARQMQGPTKGENCSRINSHCAGLRGDEVTSGDPRPASQHSHLTTPLPTACLFVLLGLRRPPPSPPRVRVD